MVTPGQVDRGASIANATVAGMQVLRSCVSCCYMFVDDVSAVSNEQHVTHVSFKNNFAGGLKSVQLCDTRTNDVLPAILAYDICCSAMIGMLCCISSAILYGED